MAVRPLGHPVRLFLITARDRHHGWRSTGTLMARRTTSATINDMEGETNGVDIMYDFVTTDGSVASFCHKANAISCVSDAKMPPVQGMNRGRILSCCRAPSGSRRAAVESGWGLAVGLWGHRKNVTMAGKPYIDNRIILSANGRMIDQHMSSDDERPATAY